MGVIFLVLNVYETTKQWCEEIEEDVLRQRDTERQESPREKGKITDTVGDLGGAKHRLDASGMPAVFGLPNPASGDYAVRPGTKVKTSFGPGQVMCYRAEDGVYQLQLGEGPSPFVWAPQLLVRFLLVSCWCSHFVHLT